MVTKNDRREHARELARAQREAQQRSRRRRRWLINGGIGAGLIAVVAIVALVVTTGAGTGAAVPANTANDAVTITSEGAVPVEAGTVDDDASTGSQDDPDVVDIVVFADYLCPYCGQFETANSEQIQQWVASGAVTLEFHPISILDRLSLGTGYSTRAANAAACIADAAPDALVAFNDLLFANQPAEQSEGLTDAELAQYAADAGAGDVSACIDGQEFAGWVSEATERASAGESSPAEAATPEVTSTPTVFVDGQLYGEWLTAQNASLSDPTAFAAFVAEVGDVPVG